jgi:hypothetical protein
MFHPRDHPMERGWVGRIDSDRVVHLAAQTLQSFFLGGGAAREHAGYALDGVAMLAPVLHPPAVRIFEGDGEFFFSNPAAILSPGAEARRPAGAEGVTAFVRPVAVVGAAGEPGGFTILGELRADGLDAPKDRDFALFLGPYVETDFVTQSYEGSFDWQRALAFAAENTQLRAGDLVAAPAVQRSALDVGGFELSVEELGVLAGRLG